MDDDDLARFLDAVPQPLVSALVLLAPLLAVAARIVQLIAWSSNWYSSALLLAAWWAFCLAGPTLFHYAFPFLLAVSLFLILNVNTAAPIVNEVVLQSAIADLTILANTPLLPPALALPPLPLLRAAAILTVPWLIITNYFVVSNRILVAVFGSLLLTHRAPWARVLRAVLSNSAILRSALLHTHAFLTGIPRPKPDSVSAQHQPTTPDPSLRFLFTVYENQRWWVGLDWTAALLPSERPSWSSPALHPVQPPSVFNLPDPSTVYLPAPDGKSRIKRTAIWRWDEPEWRLLVRTQGSSSLSRIQRPPPPHSPTIDDVNPLTPASSTSSGSRLFKAAANKFKDSASSTSTSSTASPQSPTSPPPAESCSLTDQDDSGEPFTDPDGWIFGDNKWESQSHRGGLGKYTRYRRWTRVAVVTELVDVLPPGAMGVQQQKSGRNITSLSSSSTPSSPTTTITKQDFSDPKSLSPELPSTSTHNGTTTPTPLSASVSSSTSTSLSLSPSASTINNASSGEQPESPLRQRLRAALTKTSSISVP